MKKIVVLVVLALALGSCKEDKKNIVVDLDQLQEEVVQTASIDWLLGNWKRTNDQEGRSTFESWNKTSASQYDGIGYTLAQGDTISKEYMRLILADEQWNLVVKTADDADTVTFAMTELQENSFVCVNETHDFPTHIAYKLEEGKLKAKVSNKEMEIDFEFIKE